MKLLIDEDLSPMVALKLCKEDNLDAAHVRERGLLGEPDHIVLDKAYEEDRILVTANVKDFQRLARARDLHPGIILVLHGELSRNEQLDLIRKGIKAIEYELDEGRDLVNRVVELDTDADPEFFDLPPSTD